MIYSFVKSPPVFPASLHPVTPPVALGVVLTDGLAVTAGGDVLDGGDHLVVTQLTLRHVTGSQGGCGGLWGRLESNSLRDKLLKLLQMSLKLKRKLQSLPSWLLVALLLLVA